MTTLKLDWCSHEAAKYAVEHWHYSRSMSAFKCAKIGVWEDDAFVGAIVFSVGANSNIHSPFGLDRNAVCELTRVALRRHCTPVSRIIAIALRMLKKQSSGIRLVVSYADMAQGHHGGIYQASGWVYLGKVEADSLYFVRGKWVHHRQASSLLGSIGGLPTKKSSPKHKYVMPLDDAMRKQIAPLAKPYPKRVTRDRGEIDNAPQSNAETEDASSIRSLLMDS